MRLFAVFVVLTCMFYIHSATLEASPKWKVRRCYDFFHQLSSALSVLVWQSSYSFVTPFIHPSVRLKLYESIHASIHFLQSLAWVEKKMTGGMVLLVKLQDSYNIFRASRFRTTNVAFVAKLWPNIARIITSVCNKFSKKFSRSKVSPT